MAIGWVDIERALDELIAFEDGKRFQRVAVSLCKEQFREIIATEYHKDGGEDAVAYPYLTKDGKRFDVASSITADYGKIEKDAKRIKSCGVELDFLIFCTPVKISNVPTVEKWRQDLRRDFGWDLTVVSRENIIHELLRPENQWICRLLPNLPVESDPDINDVTAKGVGAACEAIKQWQQQARYDPRCLINIDAAKLDERTPTDQLLDPAGIAESLAEGNRAVLKGTPGAGKTTTLIQIAGLLVSDHKKVPLLIALPDWAESGKDILSFICEHPDFAAAGITPKDMAALYKHGRLVFLFNGWNELDPSFLARAGRRLQQVDREFTGAGIIVATREHHVTPPLVGALSLALQPLDNERRRTYIGAVVQKGANKLIYRIETSKMLDSITRTPLFLAEIVKIYNSGAKIPDSKYGILECTIARIEQIPEHSTSLQAKPLSGRARKYLSSLAFAMTESGRVGMHYDPALTVVNKVNKQLLADGEIATMPEPKSIVDTLCAHHLLVKSVYPVSSIHFVHQQFQEFYAATRLSDMVATLCISRDENAIRAFQKDILNIPAWEESLKLIAEEISRLIAENSKMVPHEVDALVAGQELVKWAIPVDLFFAAKLVGILGKAVWNEVKGEFGPLLRKWYGYENEDYKKCALAAIFATGSNDFSDIIWPLLEHTDQQVRLSSYRAGGTFNLSCLGSNWKERICRWEEEHRLEFVRELGLRGESYALEVIEDFARKDPSPRVRANAINEIDWCGRRDKMWQVLRRSNDETFKVVVQHQLLLRKIPDDLLPRVKSIRQQLLSETENPNERLRILLRMSDIDKSESVNLMKTELEKYPTMDMSSPKTLTIHEAVAKINSEDPDWASNWVSQKQAVGKLCDEHWSMFITKVPNEIIEQVIQELLKPNCLDHKVYEVKYLMNRGATEEHAHVIVQKLIEIHCQIKGHYLKDKSEMYHRLKETAGAMAWQALTEALLEDYSEPENGSLMQVILDLAGCGALE